MACIFIIKVKEVVFGSPVILFYKHTRILVSCLPVDNARI